MSKQKTQKVKVRQYDIGIKCPSCNWETSTLFCLEGEDMKKAGNCGQCFAESLADGGFEVRRPQK